MVNSIRALKYECPYCGERYENEYEAEQCAEACVDVEDVIEVNDEIESHQCEMCGEMYSLFAEAELCEEKHRELDDKYYDEWKMKTGFIAMAMAAAHPSQIKLESFIK
jgi:predicted RNA-binding Zn-ribbon protein involved in translation (DUF1610 family)